MIINMLQDILSDTYLYNCFSWLIRINLPNQLNMHGLFCDKLGRKGLEA